MIFSNGIVKEGIFENNVFKGEEIVIPRHKALILNESSDEFQP